MFKQVMMRFPLDTEEILKRVSQEEIFELVFDKKVNTTDKYKAPYRDDRNPSCFFKYYKDTLLFNDLAYSSKGINCFQMIQKVYNLGFGDTLKLINNKLKIGLGDNSEVKEVLPVKINSFRKVEKENHITPIHIEEKEFNELDLKYWGLFGITKENLQEDSVKSLHSYIIGSEENFIGYMADKLSFVYTEFEKDKVKIYQPLSEKYKWRTNCDENDIGSIKHLTYNKKQLIITKSYKDCRVLRNFGLESIWFQNEGMFPDKKKLLELFNSYENIAIFFDNDDTGYNATKGLHKILYSFVNKIENMPSMIYIPYKLSLKGIKDISDLYRIYGKDVTKRFLVSERLL